MTTAPQQTPSEPPEMSGPGRILPRPPPALAHESESMQEQIDAIWAEVRGAHALDAFVAADFMRRRWGYVFYALGALLPTAAIVHLSITAHRVLDSLTHQGAGEPVPGQSVALWIFYALPVVASLVTGAAFFAIGGRLQMSTPAVERMEHLKAGTRTGRGALQVELPKGVKVAGSDMAE